ncbi:MAG: hypothetical protein DMG62_15915 [Acidobacteria bacterium]|nr:MAG: hypothetical protein DMG62_15915 [Acidobacteriota bacterium]
MPSLRDSDFKITYPAFHAGLSHCAPPAQQKANTKVTKAKNKVTRSLVTSFYFVTFVFASPVLV